MPSYCSHPGVLLQGCFCRLVRVSGSTWNCNDHRWLKIKLALKQMGWDSITSPAPLATKKVTGRLCTLEQPTNIWQIHPDSCEIFPFLTSDWLTVFWICFSIFFPSQTAPYLWYSLDVYRKCSQTWGTAQLLPASFSKSAAPQQMNWNPEQKLCGTKRSRVKIGWMFYFICSYILSSFMKLSNFFHSVTT